MRQVAIQFWTELSCGHGADCNLNGDASISFVNAGLVTCFTHFARESGWTNTFILLLIAVTSMHTLWAGDRHAGNGILGQDRSGRAEAFVRANGVHAFMRAWSTAVSLQSTLISIYLIQIANSSEESAV